METVQITPLRRTLQGGHKLAGQNSMSFSGFPEVIAMRNNDLHKKYQGSFHINYSSCCPILLKSTVFMHQIHLAAYGLLDAGCTQSTVSFTWGCTELT